MSDKTHIQWTDATWNPITGCSVVSPGCTNCYAMQLAGTRLKHHPSRAGLTREVNGNHVWTGHVRFNADWLTQPLRWSKPRRIFVGAHTDLFHPNVPDEWLDQIFAVMALTPHHIYQILTKRPERMREYLTRDPASRSNWTDRMYAFAQTIWPKGQEVGLGITISNGALPNVWLGVSVEDQARADERIPHLLDTPAALRWISAEPLLGPVSLRAISWSKSNRGYADALTGQTEFPTVSEGPHKCPPTSKLDWVVIGGESGPDARAMHPEWAKGLRDQCADAEVPFFFKQWGNYLPAGQIMADGRLWKPSCGTALHAAKSLAGDYLDGVQHHNWPEVKHG